MCNYTLFMGVVFMVMLSYSVLYQPELIIQQDIVYMSIILEVLYSTLNNDTDDSLKII